MTRPAQGNPVLKDIAAVRDVVTVSDVMCVQLLDIVAPAAQDTAIIVPPEHSIAKPLADRLLVSDHHGLS